MGNRPSVKKEAFKKQKLNYPINFTENEQKINTFCDLLNHGQLASSLTALIIATGFWATTSLIINMNLKLIWVYISQIK